MPSDLSVLHKDKDIMEESFDAVVEIDIDAPLAKVWEGITDPKIIKQYMHDTQVHTDWKEGSPIIWKGEWEGKSYEDKGTILAIEPYRLLKMTHWSPLSGSEDRAENYHTVQYELSNNNGTTVLVLTQGNNPSQEAADKMANNAWRPMLQKLKTVLEK